MKSSLGMLRRFELHRNDAKDKRDVQPLAQVDELAQAAQVLFFFFLSINFKFCTVLELCLLCLRCCLRNFD